MYKWPTRQMQISGKPVTGNSRCPGDRPPVPWYRNQKRMSGAPRGRHRSVSALSRQTRRRASRRRFSVANRPRSRRCAISIISYTTFRRDFARRINFCVDRSTSRLWAYKTDFTSRGFLRRFFMPRLSAEGQSRSREKVINIRWNRACGGKNATAIRTSRIAERANGIKPTTI